MNDDHLKPYHYTCAKHGNGYAEIDECPQCMKEAYMEDQAHEFDHVPKLCGQCGNYCYDSAECEAYPNYPESFFGRKKKCKYFIESINNLDDS
jgi:hypothetical protein